MIAKQKPAYQKYQFGLHPCLYHTKNLFTYFAKQKDDLHSVKLVFGTGTNVFEEALNAVEFLGWLKKFGQAQNILRPVKGQGI